ncbi:mediator complex, subunit Med18 [Gongronella butleri]|nr:mediator complex, subunit Med18 [Gongronella butleri]
MAAMYECSLQGLITSEEQKKAVIDRIIGIAGNDTMIDLVEHEIVFSPTVQTPIGPARNDDVVLRLVSRIESEQQMSLKHRQWYLCMQGNPEPQRARTAIVRPIARVQVSGDVFRYMKSLGYTYSFEVVRRGHMIVYEKMLKITITQLYKVKTKVDIKSAYLFQPETVWLVEVTSIPVAQELVSQMTAQLLRFKASINGIIDLEYVDNRALQNKVNYT